MRGDYLLKEVYDVLHEHGVGESDRLGEGGTGRPDVGVHRRVGQLPGHLLQHYQQLAHLNTARHRPFKKHT